MIVVAHSAVNVSGGVFGAMFLRISARHGSKTAYTAVARKLLVVIWHLLVNAELYVLDGFSKKPVNLCQGVVAGLSLDEMGGFCVRKYVLTNFSLRAKYIRISVFLFIISKFFGDSTLSCYYFSLHGSCFSGFSISFHIAFEFSFTFIWGFHFYHLKGGGDASP